MKRGSKYNIVICKKYISVLQSKLVVSYFLRIGTEFLIQLRKVYKAMDQYFLNSTIKHDNCMYIQLINYKVCICMVRQIVLIQYRISYIFYTTGLYILDILECETGEIILTKETVEPVFIHSSTIRLYQCNNYCFLLCNVVIICVTFRVLFSFKFESKILRLARFFDRAILDYFFEIFWQMLKSQNIFKIYTLVKVSFVAMEQKNKRQIFIQQIALILSYLYKPTFFLQLRLSGFPVPKFVYKMGILEIFVRKKEP
eukprot:TRINITY_DN17529_c0_g1_i3.p2 TRINITY_DN17529_c0_g1~~TRINITY_DN17529_c0_g1_i3.p2  ORF type:complete len:256 (-),score=-18.02 TRINITY_DN17529_c0_g1_i3:666-1433(-)